MGRKGRQVTKDLDKWKGEGEGSQRPHGKTPFHEKVV
jgi:hypothetical protein